MSAPINDGTGAPGTGNEPPASTATQPPANSAPPANSGSGDDNAWDEAAAKRKFEKMKADLDEARNKVKTLSPLAEAAEKRRKDELSEVEKLKEELAEKEKALNGYTLKEMRAQAAEEVHLTAKYAKYITATDPKEALAQAKELVEDFGTTEQSGQQSPQNQLQNRPDLRQGNRGTPPASGGKVDGNDLLRRMAERR